jgi:hypothetical protein
MVKKGKVKLLVPILLQFGEKFILILSSKFIYLFRFFSLKGLQCFTVNWSRYFFSFFFLLFFLTLSLFLLVADLQE